MLSSLRLKSVKRIAWFCASVVIAVLFLFITARAFVGPTTNSPTYAGSIISASGTTAAVGGAADGESMLKIYSAPSILYPLKIVSSDTVPIMRVVNTGVVGVGNISLDANSIYTLQTDSLLASSYRSSDYDPNHNLVAVSNWTVNSTLVGLCGATCASGDISNFKSVDADSIFPSGNVYGDVGSGVFASGNYAFPGYLGVNTSTATNLPQSLSVYGNGYFSGTDDVIYGSSSSVSIGMPTPDLSSFGHVGVGNGKVNVGASAITNSWLANWQKAIRIDGAGGALELGAGTGDFLQALSPGYAYNPADKNLYFFYTDTEYDVTGYPFFNSLFYVNPSGTVGIDNLTANGKALLVVGDSNSFDVSSISLGRSSSNNSSIVASNDSGYSQDLHVNSTSTGSMYLNNLVAGNVILGTGGGDVRVNSVAIPTTKLDVTGSLKSTGFQLPASAAQGLVLTSDLNGIGTWQSANTFPAGTQYQTLYNNGSSWVTTSNLTNNGTVVSAGSGGLTVGYSGVTPTANSLAVSGNIGIGTSNPTGILELSGSPIMRIKSSSSSLGSVDLYVITYTPSNGQAGTSICSTNSNPSGSGVCLGVWGLSGGVNRSLGCSTALFGGTERYLCADFGN